ncbi:MAG: thiamine-phosphate kinase [Terracidiphilus sp.]|jgi:thiamine-monophosphate kinase
MPRTPKTSRASSLGESALIQRIRLRASGTTPPELRLGIGDDCALLSPGPGEELAVTTDLSIAGRHFRLDWHPPESVGHRTLARGLSDLAAMGARPVAAFLSLALPRELVQKPKARSAPWIDRFLDGFLSLARDFETPLAGGDLAESPVAVADVVLTGAVRHGQALLRSGARPGDDLYVTGALGAAAAGLDRLSKLFAAVKKLRPHQRRSLQRIPDQFKALLAPHLYPTPRIAQGLWLARNATASAAIDLSDGLSTDLAHLCAESGVAAEVDAAALPIASGATPIQALNGGEDYELLFAASPQARVPSQIEGLPVTRIGRILARNASAPPVTLITPRGAVALTPRGWQHFS